MHFEDSIINIAIELCVFVPIGFCVYIVYVQCLWVFIPLWAARTANKLCNLEFARSGVGIIYLFGEFGVPFNFIRLCIGSTWESNQKTRNTCIASGMHHRGTNIMHLCQRAYHHIIECKQCSNCMNFTCTHRWERISINRASWRVELSGFPTVFLCKLLQC